MTAAPPRRAAAAAAAYAPGAGCCRGVSPGSGRVTGPRPRSLRRGQRSGRGSGGAARPGGGAPLGAQPSGTDRAGCRVPVPPPRLPAGLPHRNAVSVVIFAVVPFNLPETRHRAWRGSWKILRPFQFRYLPPEGPAPRGDVARCSSAGKTLPFQNPPASRRPVWLRCCHPSANATRLLNLGRFGEG